MKNYTLYSELVAERHNIKCYLIELPEIITEFASHYGITAGEIGVKEGLEWNI